MEVRRSFSGRLIHVFLLLSAVAFAADDRSIKSVKAERDDVLTTNPDSSFWREGDAVSADSDQYGKLLAGRSTEIRSRWTGKYLYFLFICPYETLDLKPAPNTATETYGLWDWDVAEVFLGTDFQNIGRYKEFEVSPQGEWVDLDIDRSNPHYEEGWRWNSGFESAARIDRARKVWYAAMRIPLSALEVEHPAAGRTLRVNLFRIEGAEPQRKYVAWQATMSETFHVPERFGILWLVDRPEPQKLKP
jgi:hypothetical protein